jgi:hypothetical protein
MRHGVRTSAVGKGCCALVDLAGRLRYGAGMTSETDPQEPSLPTVQPRSEPPLIERARRIGWMLLVLAVASMAAGRLGDAALRPWATGIAIGCGLIGMLAIVNVALVRGLYREIGKARHAAQPDNDDQSR